MVAQILPISFIAFGQPSRCVGDLACEPVRNRSPGNFIASRAREGYACISKFHVVLSISFASKHDGVLGLPQWDQGLSFGWGSFAYPLPDLHGSQLDAHEVPLQHAAVAQYDRLPRVGGSLCAPRHPVANRSTMSAVPCLDCCEKGASSCQQKRKGSAMEMIRWRENLIRLTGRVGESRDGCVDLI